MRRILDEGGLREATIFASGSVDEYILARLQERNAPIDGYGIGTHMDTSADAPYLDCAYKLVEYAGRGRRKRSEGKVLWPGRKQVFRRYDRQDRMTGDLLTLDGDTSAGELLLQPVMHQGRRTGAPVPLDQSRARALLGLNCLPDSLKGLEQGEEYPVEVSPAIRRLAEEVDSKQV